MEPTRIDPVGFREAQLRNWDAAAVGWMEWSEFNDRADRHISERLVELAGVREGGRVLDVAAGYGEPALTAARRVGPQGRVVATDISAEMLAFARERAAAAGMDNLEFVESDAAGLDFSPRSFDAAVSRWGIIFEPDAEAAAARIRGFLKPGARIAIASWGEPEQVPFLSLPMRRRGTGSALPRPRLERPAPFPDPPRPRSVACSGAASRRSPWRRTR